MRLIVREAIGLTKKIGIPTNLLRDKEAYTAETAEKKVYINS